MLIMLMVWIKWCCAWCIARIAWPALCRGFYQKSPRVRKIRVRNSGAGNGCTNFMDTWKNAFFLQENLCP